MGNEFNVAGYSTGATLQSAIDDSDYLTFSVQAVTGMTMIPDSVSFTLWRQGSGSAQDYAILSSVNGFANGQQLGQTHVATIGSGNQQIVTGTFGSAQQTTDPVEFRLYGWNAASEADNTQVVGASLRRAVRVGRWNIDRPDGRVNGAWRLLPFGGRQIGDRLGGACSRH